MDLQYWTIPVFGVQEKILYKEAKFLYVMSDAKKSKNLHFYFVEEFMGCYSLSINPKALMEANVLPFEIERHMS